MTRRTLAGAIGALGAVAAASAVARVGFAPVDLQVVDRETGRVLPVWRHDGRLYVAGRPGARYGLRVSNRTSRRVLVVMSVDGVNVLSGQTAGVDQRGYIFDPYSHYDVTGWRKSETEVAAFTFAAQSRSYAALTGRPADVGVIGIAVFDERPPRPPPPPPAAAPKAAPPPAAATRDRAAAEGYDAPAPNEKLGTGHGARERSVSHVEPFERASSRPFFTSQIEYDTYANLVAGGVIPRHVPPPPRHPRPFPDTPDDSSFVPDPPDGL